MLLYLLATIALFLSSITIAARWFGSAPLVALLAFLVLVLTQVTGIQLLLGAIGQLYPIAVTVAAIALCVGLLLVNRRLQPIALFDKPDDSQLNNPDEERRLSLLGFGILALVGVVLLGPIAAIVPELLQQLRQVHPLSWDVVSYHLPNAIDYLQAHSLWNLTGSYAYYPGGNELLNLWSMGPLRHEGAIGLTTLTLVLGIALAVGLSARSLLPNSHPFWQGLVAILTLGLCLYVQPLQLMLFDFGRNDITIAFWQVLALGLLLQNLQTPTAFWRISLGVCTGMLIGIKPNGAFLAVGLWAVVFWGSGYRLKSLLREIVTPALAIGGFWYLRNLVVFGRFSPPNQLSGAMDLSIAANLFNPQLYAPNAPLFWLVGSFVLAIVTLIADPLMAKPRNNRMQLTAIWLLISLLGLSLTPSGAGYFAGAGKTFLIQLRYGAAIVPFTLLLLGAWCDRLGLFDRLTLPNALTQALAPNNKLPLTIVPLVLTSLVFLTTTYKPPQGLPAYEGIFFPSGKNPSGLYGWVQEHLRDRTIFSVGPRPLGLYGPNWTNRVTAHLGATQIPAIPPATTDLIITYDPFTRQLPNNLRQVAQTDGWTITYQDNLALVLHRAAKK